jgi:hypothetical protein
MCELILTVHAVTYCARCSSLCALFPPVQVVTSCASCHFLCKLSLPVLVDSVRCYWLCSCWILTCWTYCLCAAVTIAATPAGSNPYGKMELVERLQQLKEKSGKTYTTLGEMCRRWVRAGALMGINLTNSLWLKACSHLVSSGDEMGLSNVYTAMLLQHQVGKCKSHTCKNRCTSTIVHL